MALSLLLMPHILKFEGGFVNDPADRGGATNKGVTIGTFRKFYGKERTVEDLKKITDKQWLHIFEAGYWNPMRGDDIDNQSIADFLVDWAYNAGVHAVAIRLQTILKVKVDGIVGPKTIAAINAADQRKLFDSLKQWRTDFYQDIVRRSPSQRKFLKGWLNRTNHYTFKP